jgi:hypothetical protein
VVRWAQSVISKWTGFSRIAAAVLLPRRLLAPIAWIYCRTSLVATTLSVLR